MRRGRVPGRRAERPAGLYEGLRTPSYCRPVRARVGTVAAVLFALGCATPAYALDFHSCKHDTEDGSSCAGITVPLDRSGTVAGTVRLRLTRWRAEHPTGAPLIFVGGDPGEASTLRFGSWTVEDLLTDPDDFRRDAPRSRDAIAIDLRGTGHSGLLRCSQLEDAAPLDSAVAACAASLGERRGLYTARDSAEDIEAVRQALGVEKVAVLGSAYGAEVAFTYARRHPERIDRLVLDSIAGSRGFDALYRSAFATIPEAIQVLCRKNRCHHASSDPLADFTALAQRAERGPLVGRVFGRDGHPHRARMSAFGLFQALLQAVNGDRTMMGLLHNARRGDLTPLLRSRKSTLDGVIWPPAPIPAGFLSFFNPTAYLASRCEESQLPWSRTAPIADRHRIAAAFVSALPGDAFSPFGPRAALGSDVLDLCDAWPIASLAQDPPVRLPAIPTLLVTSVDDMLAPVSAAREVANLIPGSRVLRLRGAGHGIFADGGSSCASRIAHAFLIGRAPTPRDVCGPEWNSARGAAKPPPLSLAEVSPDPRVGGTPGRVLRTVNATIGDGGDQVIAEFFTRVYSLRSLPRREWRAFFLRPVRAVGLRGGTYAINLKRGRLFIRGASYVPGVRLNGWLRFSQQPKARRGVIRVSAPRAARGRLVIRRGMMRGRLGGVKVSAPMRLGQEFGLTYNRKASSAQSAKTGRRSLPRLP